MTDISQLQHLQRNIVLGIRMQTSAAIMSNSAKMKTMRATWRKMKLPTMAENTWATHDGDVLVMKSPRSVLRWRTYSMVEDKECAWSMRVGPMNVSRWNHMGLPQQRYDVGHTHGNIG